MQHFLSGVRILWTAISLLFAAATGLVVFILASRRARSGEGLLGVQIDDYKTAFEEEKRKRLEVLGVIEAIQKERNQFRDWWWTCSLEHGAAQRFMSDEIMRCYRLLQKNNIKVRERPEVLALPEAYDKAHGVEKLVEEAGRIERTRSELHAEIEAKGVAKEDPNA